MDKSAENPKRLKIGWPEIGEWTFKPLAEHLKQASRR